MSKNYTTKKGISSFIIRLIAVIAMVVNFLCRTKTTFLYNPALANCMLWFSYTLFAFLLAQGIKHTSNRKLYIRRMILFTIISELCYDFYTFGKIYNKNSQSIMLTLFISFMIMIICDYLNRRFKNLIINIAAILLLTLGGIKLSTLLMSNFGSTGILISMLFYSSLNLTYDKVYQLALMLYYTYMVTSTSLITLSVFNFQISLPIAIFAIFALIITWFYNDQRGPNEIILKIAFYSIYPLLLVIFGLIKIL